MLKDFNLKRAKFVSMFNSSVSVSAVNHDVYHPILKHQKHFFNPNILEKDLDEHKCD